MRWHAISLALVLLPVGCDRLLPRASGTQRPLVVELSEDGTVRVSGGEVSLQELRTVLRKKALASPKNAEDRLPLLVVEISAHPDCDYAHVQKVMLQCMRESIWRVRWRMGDRVLDTDLRARVGPGAFLAEEPSREMFKGAQNLTADKLLEHPVIVHEEVEIIDDFQMADEADAEEAEPSRAVIDELRPPPTQVRIKLSRAEGGAVRTMLGRKPCVDLNELAARLAALVEGDPRLAVVIDARKDVPFRWVFGALDACKRAKVKDVRFQAPPVDDKWWYE